MPRWQKATSDGNCPFSLAEYGAFIDIGGVDGLLHISDISWSRINNPADVLTVGQQVEAKVLKIEPEKQRISLGMKQLQPHPWDAVPEKYNLGQRVTGTVTRPRISEHSSSSSPVSKALFIYPRCHGAKKFAKPAM